MTEAAPGGPGLALTLLLALLGLGVIALAAWRHGRPPDVSGRARPNPWLFVLTFAAALTLLLLVHAVNLLGLETGRMRF